METKDLIVFTLKSGKKLLWKIDSFYVGGLCQESIVILLPVDRKGAENENGDISTAIPHPILEEAIKAGVVDHYSFNEQEMH